METRLWKPPHMKHRQTLERLLCSDRTLDNLHLRFLKELAHDSSEPVARIFNEGIKPWNNTILLKNGKYNRVYSTEGKIDIDNNLLQEHLQH